MTLQLVRTTEECSDFFDGGMSAEIWVKESDHRIANNLQLVGGLLRLQASSLAKRQRAPTLEETLAALDEAGRRIETVGRLHRLLARREDPEAVDVTEFLQEIAVATIASQTSAGRARLSFLFAERCGVPARQALAMGLIVGELVTNSVKYAHPAGVHGVISVSCARSAAGGIVIEVADDGVGLPEGFDPDQAESLGLTLIRGLTRQLGARLVFLRDGIGLTVRLSAPA